MHRVLWWGTRIVGGLLVLLAVILAGAYAASQRRVSRTFPVGAHALAVVPDPTAAPLVAEGARLAKARGCTECHGVGLGGRVLMNDAAFARLAASDLTRGAALTDADWERAVRHGVRRDGTPLLLMPAEAFNGLSDEELAAIVSYARTLPPATTALPAPRLGPVARALLAAGKLQFLPAEVIDHARPHAARVVAETTPAFGAYLAEGCKGCHNVDLTGGPGGGPPGGPPPKNITPDPATGIGTWREAQFLHALRTGERPDGGRIDTTAMPIAMTRELTDVELSALYRYLRTVPAKAYATH